MHTLINGFTVSSPQQHSYCFRGLTQIIVSHLEMVLLQTIYITNVLMYLTSNAFISFQSLHIRIVSVL